MEKKKRTHEIKEKMFRDEGIDPNRIYNEEKSHMIG